jgi:hypothetical protein
LALRALARLAHPEPPLVRGAAEVAGPALAAKPLTTSTFSAADNPQPAGLPP